jgi:glycosyltransferase involved in cell wall biosynthesis
MRMSGGDGACGFASAGPRTPGPSDWRARAPRTVTGVTPRFSVVVPTYDRMESLERCLAALAAQELGRDGFEVVVVNDGGACSPRDVVARYRDALDVRLIEQENAGPAAARNAGAAASRGAYLVFTDDDCRPEPHWLSGLAESAAAFPGRAVGGRVDNALSDGIYSTASQLLIEFLYEYYNVVGDQGRFFITSNVAFPAARFRELGGFDATFPLAAAEDRDMCDRWLEHGNAMVYADDAVVQHAHALGFLSFCRQHLNYGRGACHLHLARARRGVTRVRLEPMRYYSRLVAYPMRRGGSVRAAALSALMLVSQVVYATGYVFERLTAGRGETGGR